MVLVGSSSLVVVKWSPFPLVAMAHQVCLLIGQELHPNKAVRLGNIQRSHCFLEHSMAYSEIYFRPEKLGAKSTYVESQQLPSTIIIFSLAVEIIVGGRNEPEQQFCPVGQHVCWLTLHVKNPKGQKSVFRMFKAEPPADWLIIGSAVREEPGFRRRCCNTRTPTASTTARNE